MRAAFSISSVKTPRFGRGVSANSGVEPCLGELDGGAFLKQADYERRTSPELRQYLRPREEIADINARTAPGEPRFNADGTIDFLRWSRPQFDGPAVRALVCLNFAKGLSCEPVKANANKLIRQDLEFTALAGGKICYDIWEEEFAQHYYTTLAQAAALNKGAAWAEDQGDTQLGGLLRTKATELNGLLERFWDPSAAILLSRLSSQGARHPKALDFSVILGVLHAGLDGGANSVQDERVRSTLDKLAELFSAGYAINRGAGDGIAFGRYANDRYFSGGAYYFSTFGAAEFYYRAAAYGREDRERLIGKGDAILAAASRSVPESGDLSEQFDQTTGCQTSARNLSWSYAAYLTAWHARNLACSG